MRRPLSHSPAGRLGAAMVVAGMVVAAANDPGSTGTSAVTFTRWPGCIFCS